MAFRILTGTMGGGKSYRGAELCAQYWKEGAVVHTNIDIVDDEVESRGWTDRFVRLGDDPAAWIERIVGGAEGAENLVVIDEGMLLFDAHDWQATKKKHRTLLEFLVWSRKLGLDVYLIGQAQKGMDVSFTRMAQEIIGCVAVKRLPFVGPLLVTLRGDFLRVHKYATGVKSGRREWSRFRPEIGSLYRTESTHGRFENVPRRVGRSTVDDAALRRRSWMGVAIFIGVIVSVFGGILTGARAMFASREAPGASEDGGGETGAMVARVETPSLASGSGMPVAAPEAMRVWGTSDFGRMEFWAAGGQRVAVGEVYDDAIVAAIDMSRRVFVIRLDDGRIFKFRPATNKDKPKEENKWNSEFSRPSWLHFGDRGESR